MKKETTQNTENQAVRGMDNIFAFTNYLQSIDYSLEGLSFEDAVSLMINVENLISERLTK